jgi:2-keto-4-pentenoate hydratase/2-oxohepta-3-ene-1,7-dioic acid hydratase in catechol pathway
MHYARFQTDDGELVAGDLEDGVLTTESGDAYVVGEDGSLASPCDPSAFYCVGRNYTAKIDQMEYDVPDIPDWFIKPPVALLAPGADIVYPRWTNELTYAGELAAVIGEECHEIDEERVDDHVWGYTILNDLDALDQERRTARKAFDGSGPLGPAIATDVDPANLDMTTHVGGELRQEANTDQMLFRPREVVAFMSERYTLRRGDVISFGSPANPGGLEVGDDVEIWYEGVGTLENTVVAPE